MGKGDYNGGGTLVSSGGWSSIDPAEDKRVYLNSGSRKRAVAFATGKKQGKQRSTLEYASLNYLHAIADAKLKGNSLPKIPKTFDQILAGQIKLAGDVEKWANAQPDFKKILDKKCVKLKKQKIQVIPSGDNKQKANAAEERVAFELLRNEIIEFSTRLADLDAIAKNLRKKLSAFLDGQS